MFKALHMPRLLHNTRDGFDMSLSPVNGNGNFTQAGQIRPLESPIPFPRDIYTTSEKGITFVAAQQRWSSDYLLVTSLKPPSRTLMNPRKNRECAITWNTNMTSIASLAQARSSPN